jgi:glycosyltransferase involved in cell wall biosynthesis
MVIFMKMQARNDDNFCVVIPVYNHERTVAEVARQALKLNLPVFIVDDGSSDTSYVRIKNIKVCEFCVI